jgi:transposase
MKEGGVATYAQAQEFLAERGIEYSGPDSVGGLLRRRKAKLKTGRPRHQQADRQEQEAFKKSSPTALPTALPSASGGPKANSSTPRAPRSR